MKNNISMMSLLLSGVVLTISGCGNESSNEQTTEPVDTKTDIVVEEKPEANSDWTTYRVGMDNDYPPYVMRDEHGLTTGFDVEILQAIAKDQQFNIEPIPVKWDKLVVNVDAGKYDMAVGGFAEVEVTDTAKEHYSLSNPYIYAQDAIGIINQDIKINKLDDLKNYNVSTLKDTTWVTDITGLKGGTGTLKAEASSFTAVQDLIQKKVDITLNGRGVLLYYSNSMPEFNIQVNTIDGFDNTYDLVFLANKNQPELVSKINTGLADIVKDGRYEEIYMKWFGVAPNKLPEAAQ